MSCKKKKLQNELIIITTIKILGICALLIVTLLAIAPSLTMADNASTASAISSTREEILKCYSAAGEAEAAGANVSSLTLILNQASNLLDRAEFAYHEGNFDVALNYTQQSQKSLVSLLPNASTLKEEATQQMTWNFWLNTVGSTIGAITVILLGIAMWLRFQKNRTTSG